MKVNLKFSLPCKGILAYLTGLKVTLTLKMCLMTAMVFVEHSTIYRATNIFTSSDVTHVLEKLFVTNLGRSIDSKVSFCS